MTPRRRVQHCHASLTADRVLPYEPEQSRTSDGMALIYVLLEDTGPAGCTDLRSSLPPYLPCLTDMLGVAARGAVESTRRFVVEYAREWQPADERSAARLSEALGRLSASINSHDVTLLEKPGGRCSLLKGTAPRWPFLAAPTWEECLATRTLRIPRGAAGQGR